MPSRGRSRRSQRGQVVPLFAVVLTLLIGVASLSIDATIDQSSQLRSQLAADSAALGTAKAWGADSRFAAGTLPTVATDAVLVQARRLAGVNGVDTSAGGSCFTSSAGQIDVFFYDTAVTSCTSAPGLSPGWGRKVEVAIPPLPTPVPAKCSTLPAKSYQCVQVQTTAIVSNRLFVTFGMAKTTTSASTIALAAAASGAASTDVWTWGDNAAGENGDGTSGTMQSLPKSASAVAGNAVALAGGAKTNFALQADGTVVDWGLHDASLELGNGAAAIGSGCLCIATPAPVPGLSNITQIVSNQDTTMARDANGNVWAWGANGQGQLGNSTVTPSGVPIKVPKGGCACPNGGGFLDNVVTIGEGWQTSYAVRGDGTIWAWGDNSNAEIETTKAVHQAPFQVTAPGTSIVISITGGDHDTLMLEANGTVWAWGRNSYGQTGPGGVVGSDTLVPKQVTLLSATPMTMVAIAAGGYSNYAVTGGAPNTGSGSGNTGEVRAWGRDDKGQLGENGWTAANKTKPVGVWRGDNGQFLERVTSLVAGTNDAYVRKSDGDVYGWGDNSLDQLGQGSNGIVVDAFPMGDPAAGQNPADGSSGIHNVTQIAASGNHSIIIASPPIPQAWGGNGSGQLGNGGVLTPNSSPAPVTDGGNVNPLTPLTSGSGPVAAGSSHSLAVGSDGNLYGWGSNGSGQLCNGGVVTPRTRAVMTGSFLDTNAVAVAAGTNWDLILRYDGAVAGCGVDSWGQLDQGTGPVPSVTYFSSPMLNSLAGQNSAVKAIAAGQDFGLFLLPDGTVRSLGRNTNGELGDGNVTTVTSSPVQVLKSAGVPLANVVGIAAGNDFAVAVTADGKVYAWGANDHGQLGSGTACPCSAANVLYATPVTGGVIGTTAFGTAVTAGQNSAEVLASDGTVYAFGTDASGQLGDNAAIPADNSTPRQVLGTGGSGILTAVKLISAGTGFDTAVTANGTLWGWGTNTNGELGLGNTSSPQKTIQPALITGVTGLATSAHTVATRSAPPVSASVSVVLVG